MAKNKQPVSASNTKEPVGAKTDQRTLPQKQGIAAYTLKYKGIF
ncbi:hypothetical protein predicted by Glimmer/Critica [Acetobacter ghanensis]|uniref:Uncharacterized protein n=1 Tax=Acetobacter ghanensis TaxID=431306 RepID=A0A0U5F7Y1_9PROT|nr:hypothetical protein predicted by Glimmer/Critica [Acetobacter ghanensis]